MYPYHFGQKSPPHELRSSYATDVIFEFLRYPGVVSPWSDGKWLKGAVYMMTITLNLWIYSQGKSWGGNFHLLYVIHLTASYAKCLCWRSFFSQNILSKFLVNPEIDEKVSEVVEVDQVESVGRYEQVAVDSEYDACVAEDGQQEEAHSNFDRFLVTCYVCGVT